MDKLVRLCGHISGFRMYQCPICDAVIYDIYIDPDDEYYHNVNRQYCINCGVEMIKLEDDENDGK